MQQLSSYEQHYISCYNELLISLCQNILTIVVIIQVSRSTEGSNKDWLRVMFCEAQPFVIYICHLHFSSFIAEINFPDILLYCFSLFFLSISVEFIKLPTILSDSTFERTCDPPLVIFRSLSTELYEICISIGLDLGGGLTKIERTVNLDYLFILGVTLYQATDINQHTGTFSSVY